MAFGRFERPPGPSPMSDINMTPLIDVMLVLLVIFIIAAPLMATSLRLDLPQTTGATPSDAPATLAVALDEQGRWYLGGDPISAEALQARVRQAAQAQPTTEVQLRADRGVPYGEVARLIGVVQAGGLTRIGFVTEAPPR